MNEYFIPSIFLLGLLSLPIGVASPAFGGFKSPNSNLNINSGQSLNLITLQPPTVEQIKQIAIQQQATLVQYSIISNSSTDSDLYIWVVQPTGEIHLRQNHLNQSLTELITDLRHLIEVRDFSNSNQIDQSLHQLYQILIQPIAELLPIEPEERVIFIPQSSLFLVPFAALIDNQGQYLIERHTIFTAPAIQVLALRLRSVPKLTRQRRQQIEGNAEEILIVGNPTPSQVPFNSEELPQLLSPLPYAEKEAIEIGRVCNTEPLIGTQATESVVTEKMLRARIIHLATHNILDTGDDIPGAIVLAADSPNSTDGLLTAAEIQALNLNAELVILSGSNTGLGKITSDGVMGLSRAFMVAGTPSVVVSLWAVPDVPTSQLMIEFHRQLQQQGKDKAQALRQAMLITMQQYPAPRDWAGFILMGEAD